MCYSLKKKLQRINSARFRPHNFFFFDDGDHGRSNDHSAINLPYLGRVTGKTTRLIIACLITQSRTSSDVTAEVGEATVSQTDRSIVCDAGSIVYRKKAKETNAVNAL